MLSRLSLIWFLLIFVTSSFSQTANIAPESVGISSYRLDRYENFLEREIENRNIPGAVSLIVRNGQVVHHKAMGYSSLASEKRMQTNQVFYIQSMTKPIISVAFMMLYEEGHFLLTDPVSKYLPAFKNLKVTTNIDDGATGETVALERQVTIAHLLTHTAGFSHGLGSSKLDNDLLRALYFEPHKDIESRVNALLGLPLIGQPGELWYYSASPDVLALLIEHFSRMPVSEFLQKRLFDPLEMNDTGYNLDADKRSRMVQLHRYNDDGLLEESPRQTPLQGNNVFGGTHGLFSTAEDYMTFCQMMLNYGEWNGIRILSRKTVELMTDNHVGDLYHTPGQGFGLGFGVTTDLSDSKAAGSVGQYYWGGAYCTYFFIDPIEELIAILMTQVTPYSDYYSKKFRQFVYQAIAD